MNTSNIPSTIDFSDHSAVTRAIVSISNGAELALVAAQLRAFEESSKTATLSIENQTLFLEKISDIIEADNDAIFQDNTCLFSISEVFRFWNRKIGHSASPAARRVWTQMFDLATLQILPRTKSIQVHRVVCSMSELDIDGRVDTNRVGESTAAISTLFSMKCFNAIFAHLPQLNDTAFKALVALPDEDVRVAAFDMLFQCRTNCLALAELLVNHIDLRHFANINTHLHCCSGIIIGTPLTIAVYWRNLPLCRKLVAAGADVNGFIIDPETKEKKRGWYFRPPVVAAARNNDAEMVDFFVNKCRADYKLVDCDGFDVMTSAVSSFDRVDGDHRLIDYFLNLDPDHFRKMITADNIAKCSSCPDDSPGVRVKRVRPITLSYLANQSGSRSVSSSQAQQQQQQQHQQSRNDELFQRGSALVSASVKKIRPQKELDEAHTEIASRSSQLQQEKQKSSSSSDLEKENQQRKPLKQLLFTTSSNSNQNRNQGAVSDV